MELIADSEKILALQTERKESWGKRVWWLALLILLSLMAPFVIGELRQSQHFEALRSFLRQEDWWLLMCR